MACLDLSAQLQRRGWPGDVVALAPLRDGAGLPSAVDVLGGSPLHPQVIAELRRRAPQYSLVLAHGSSTLPASALALCGTPTPYAYVNIGDPVYWANTRSRRLRVRMALRSAAGVVALTDGARASFIQHLAVPPRLIEVIPNFRSKDRFYPADQLLRQQWRSANGLPSEGNLALCLGALSREKRIDVAINAIARLDDVVLVIAGSGECESDLRDLAARRAPTKVIFLGSTTEPEHLLQAVDVLVMSSDSEGLPGVIIEAGLTGVPSAVTDVGWIREIVVPGETGFIAPPGNAERLADAIRNVLRDRDALGRSARKHCLAKFETGPVLARWSQFLYEKVGIPGAKVGQND